MRFETMPSRPSLQAWAKTVGLSPSICLLNRKSWLLSVFVIFFVVEERV